MKHFKNLIIALMLTMLMPLFAVTAFADNAYGVTTKVSPEVVKPGEQVEVTISLTGYEDTLQLEELIRGLQVDVELDDNSPLTLISYNSLIDDKKALSNTASYNDENNFVRLFYVQKDEVLPINTSDVLKITFEMGSQITGTGSATLPVSVKIVTTNQNPTERNDLSENCIINYSDAIPDATVLINGIRYEKIQDAFDAAQHGDTVKLLKDVQVNILQIDEGITLDLNGNHVTASYVMCFGNIVDSSRSNDGLLEVSDRRFMIREDNEQLSVRTVDGFKFYEISKINQAVLYNSDDKTVPIDAAKTVFQPIFEAVSHSDILAENSGVTIEVHLSWNREDETVSTQKFVYNNSFVEGYFDSYDETTGRYGKMFTLKLNSVNNYNNLTYKICVASSTGVKFLSDSGIINTDF